MNKTSDEIKFSKKTLIYGCCFIVLSFIFTSVSWAKAYTITQSIKGLERPWGFDFVNHNHMIVSQKGGQFIIINLDDQSRQSIKPQAIIAHGGQGGLLDVIIDPAYEQSHLIFFTFSEDTGAGSATALARAKLVFEHNQWSLKDEKVIFRQNKATASTYHFGSRLAITPHQSIYMTIGDRGSPERAQDADDHAGSILHLSFDGKAMPENVFNSETWSVGHRNPQGIIYDRDTNEVWTIEHGARGGDELNKPENGKNYGWPVISYGVNYNGSKIGEGQKKQGLEQPVYYWDPSIAPSSLIRYSGKMFSKWKGDFFASALAGQKLVRLEMDGDVVIGEHTLLDELDARIRKVMEGPDGGIWIITDDDDGIALKIEPKEL